MAQALRGYPTVRQARTQPSRVSRAPVTVGGGRSSPSPALRRLNSALTKASRGRARVNTVQRLIAGRGVSTASATAASAAPIYSPVERPTYSEDYFSRGRVSGHATPAASRYLRGNLQIYRAARTAAYRGMGSLGILGILASELPDLLDAIGGLYNPTRPSTAWHGGPYYYAGHVTIDDFYQPSGWCNFSNGTPMDWRGLAVTGACLTLQAGGTNINVAVPANWNGVHLARWSGANFRWATRQAWARITTSPNPAVNVRQKWRALGKVQDIGRVSFLDPELLPIGGWRPQNNIGWAETPPLTQDQYIRSRDSRRSGPNNHLGQDRLPWHVSRQANRWWFREAGHEMSERAPNLKPYQRPSFRLEAEIPGGPRPARPPRARPGVHNSTRPRRGSKEKKGGESGKVGNLFRAVAGSVTEATDVVKAIFQALPKDLQTEIWLKNGRFLSPSDMAWAALANLDEIDVGEAVINLAAEQIQDMIVAKGSKFAQKSNPIGHGTGTRGAGWVRQALSDYVSGGETSTPGYVQTEEEKKRR